MKKLLKRLLSIVVTVNLTIATALVVSAVESPVYELENQEYREFLDNYSHRLPYDEELVEWINSISPELPEEFDIMRLTHVYSKYPGSRVSNCYFGDYEYFFRPDLKKAHIFCSIGIDWDGIYSKDKDFYNTYTKEEVNEFLKVNNLKGRFDDNPNSEEYVKYLIHYDEGVTEEDMILTFLKLKERYNMTIQVTAIAMESKFFYEESMTDTEEITSSESNLNTTVITGDIDLNGRFDLSDVLVLVKYNMNSEIFPITECAALDNADVNKDGIINTSDVSLLVEIMLSGYESVKT